MRSNAETSVESSQERTRAHIVWSTTRASPRGRDTPVTRTFFHPRLHVAYCSGSACREFSGICPVSKYFCFGFLQLILYSRVHNRCRYVQSKTGESGRRRRYNTIQHLYNIPVRNIRGGSAAALRTCAFVCRRDVVNVHRSSGMFVAAVSPHLITVGRRLQRYFVITIFYYRRIIPAEIDHLVSSKSAGQIIFYVRARS